MAISKSLCFSVYGQNPMYCTGMLKNLELSKAIYPDWTVEIYYDSTVPSDYIEKYKKFDNAKFYDMSCSGVYNGMLWRFLSESDIWCSRDCDSRLSMREKIAVDEWIESGKALHILRDHPAHCSLLNLDIHILGGMFGVRKTGIGLDFAATIDNWVKNNKNHSYGQDQVFLKNIYNFYKSQNQIFCHDSLSGVDNALPFPTNHTILYNFVGEVFDEKDARREDHYRDWVRFADKERKR